jgi:hypothetical protein
LADYFDFSSKSHVPPPAGTVAFNSDMLWFCATAR